MFNTILTGADLDVLNPALSLGLLLQALKVQGIGALKRYYLSPWTLREDVVQSP